MHISAILIYSGGITACNLHKSHAFLTEKNSR